MRAPGPVVFFFKHGHRETLNCADHLLRCAPSDIQERRPHRHGGPRARRTSSAFQVQPLRRYHGMRFLSFCPLLRCCFSKASHPCPASRLLPSHAPSPSPGPPHILCTGVVLNPRTLHRLKAMGVPPRVACPPPLGWRVPGATVLEAAEDWGTCTHLVCRPAAESYRPKSAASINQSFADGATLIFRPRVSVFHNSVPLFPHLMQAAGRLANPVPRNSRIPP